MEIIKDNRNKCKCISPVFKNIYLGILVIASGIIWLCYNLDIIGPGILDHIFSWQVLLMAIGGYLMLANKLIAGAVLFCAGIIVALIDWANIQIPIGEILMPGMIIAVGIIIIVQNFGKRRP